MIQGYIIQKTSTCQNLIPKILIPATAAEYSDSLIQSEKNVKYIKENQDIRKKVLSKVSAYFI